MMRTALRISLAKPCFSPISTQTGSGWKPGNGIVCEFIETTCFSLPLLIEPDSLDDVINPQCDEAETNLPVDSANRTVLHPVK